MGIRGGFVLAFWRRFFWIAAEVVLLLVVAVMWPGAARGARHSSIVTSCHLRWVADRLGSARGEQAARGCPSLAVA